MRASGYSEALGFTVHDTMIYKRHLEQLVREEVEVMMERVAGEMDTEEAADLLEQAVEPMRDLVAALRAKLLVSELRARRAAQQLLSDLAIRAAEPPRPRRPVRDLRRCGGGGRCVSARAAGGRAMFREGWCEGKTGGVRRGGRTVPWPARITCCRTSTAPPRTSPTRDTWWRGAYRRHGVGRALVEHSLARGEGRDSTRMMFNLVLESNPARHLYEGLGFRGGRPRAGGDRRRGRDRLLAML